jgi:hypothetical protein
MTGELFQRLLREDYSKYTKIYYRDTTGIQQDLTGRQIEVPNKKDVCSCKH